MVEINKQFLIQIVNLLTHKVNKIISTTFRDLEIISDYQSLLKEGNRTEEILEKLSNKPYSDQFLSESTIRFIVYQKYSKKM